MRSPLPSSPARARTAALLALASCALTSCASTSARPHEGPAGAITSASATESASDGPTAEEAFSSAKALFDKKEYGPAIEGFAAARKAARLEHERAVEAWELADEARADRSKPGPKSPPPPPVMASALYYEGIAESIDGEKYSAHERFREILAEHRSFPEIADVVKRDYEIGLEFVEGKAERPVPVLSFLHMTSESLGAETLEYLLANYQQKYFDYAQYQVAEHYFRRRDFRRAADAYLSVEQQFRDSPWAAAAQVRRALCFMGQSRGYAYDPAPIDRAEEVLLDYVRRNPTGSRISEAETALTEIRDGRAALFAVNARFYNFRERRPRAALVYAEALLRETPGAPAAEDAQDILEDVIRRSEESDPACAAQARDALAALARRKEAGPAPRQEPPPTLVPGGGRPRQR